MPDSTLYDKQHRALRASIQRTIDEGQVVLCRRCRTRLHGRAWDLGHAANRRDHAGPECIPCNRATRTHAAAARKRPKPTHPSKETP